MHLSFSLRRWTACSPYHLSREDWQRWAADGLDVDAQRERKRPPLEFIAPLERRRLNQPARLMFSALHQLHLPDDTPLVFASRDGETNRSFSLWLELLREGTMSPLSFGLSVHNALAGSWSLHKRNRAQMNALAATEAVLETALLEACILLFEGAPLVAVAVVEDPIDDAYDVLAVRAPFPYALAMLVENGDTCRVDFIAPLLQTGLSREALLAALDREIARADISFDAALDTPFGAPWRALYPGKIGQEHVAVVRLFGIRDLSALRAGIAEIPGAVVCAPRAKISRAFEHTRWSALALKLASWPLAFLLLAWCFGSRRAAAMLAVPLCAAAVTIALIGWMGKTFSVFAVFALLLVLAIGIDYAVYALAGSGGRRAKLGGIVLAGMTTLITFGMLGFSATPAVSTFGLCIAVGVFFSALFACFLLIPSHRP